MCLSCVKRMHALNDACFVERVTVVTSYSVTVVRYKFPVIVLSGFIQVETF